MRLRIIGAVLIPLVVSALHKQAAQQATIEDTGSTNRPGIKLTVNSEGKAELVSKDATLHAVGINPQTATRLFEDLKTIGPLNALPRTHCFKSISFGSSLYLEFNGERSPDLNCPAPPGSEIAKLQEHVRELLRAAKAVTATGTRSPRPSQR